MVRGALLVIPSVVGARVDGGSVVVVLLVVVAVVVVALVVVVGSSIHEKYVFSLVGVKSG